MKARVKATGEIVEVRKSDGYYDTIDGVERYYPCELDFQDVFDYWEKLKHQYAGMAMQGLMTILPNIGGIEGRTPKDEIVDIAISSAHALVEKMKEKEERK